LGAALGAAATTQGDRDYRYRRVYNGPVYERPYVVERPYYAPPPPRYYAPPPRYVVERRVYVEDRGYRRGPPPWARHHHRHHRHWRDWD
ncbi:MAG TPA: hypothetical protein PK403_15650, partial [Plasticicumulans sp.]|nr:hypothetical protein [Plasticicumulans sp.]